jgi:hypothetical protein
MNEIKNDGHSFVGYEYKQVITNTNRVSLLIDGYKNFGWTVDDNINPGAAELLSSNANVVLRLKRDRKIINKMELTRLQRNFEFCLKEIDHLEKSKTSEATMYALIVGIVGTAFMAGSVFAVTAEPPRVMLCILLAIPAFSGWIFPYFIYNYTVSKKTEKANLLIEEKQDEIFEICEKGNKLLH